jgi:DNA repair exonuclease SbcCD ATPase subunit
MDYKKMYEELQQKYDELEEEHDTLNKAVDNNYITLEEHNEYYAEWKDKAERCDELEKELEEAKQENKKLDVLFVKKIKAMDALLMDYHNQKIAEKKFE